MRLRGIVFATPTDVSELKSGLLLISLGLPLVVVGTFGIPVSAQPYDRLLQTVPAFWWGLLLAASGGTQLGFLVRRDGLVQRRLLAGWTAALWTLLAGFFFCAGPLLPSWPLALAQGALCAWCHLRLGAEIHGAALCRPPS